MARVPAPIPSESDAKREDVEDDGEPEQAVGGVEADAVLSYVGCDCCGGHAQWIRHSIGVTASNLYRSSRAIL